jgi:hypothetical protein
MFRKNLLPATYRGRQYTNPGQGGSRMLRKVNTKLYGITRQKTATVLIIVEARPICPLFIAISVLMRRMIRVQFRYKKAHSTQECSGHWRWHPLAETCWGRIWIELIKSITSLVICWSFYSVKFVFIPLKHNGYYTYHLTVTYRVHFTHRACLVVTCNWDNKVITSLNAITLPSPYRAVNTFHLGYKNQPVCAVCGTSTDRFI